MAIWEEQFFRLYLAEESPPPLFKHLYSQYCQILGDDISGGDKYIYVGFPVVYIKYQNFLDVCGAVYILNCDKHWKLSKPILQCQMPSDIEVMFSRKRLPNFNFQPTLYTQFRQVLAILHGNFSGALLRDLLDFCGYKCNIVGHLALHLRDLDKFTNITISPIMKQLVAIRDILDLKDFLHRYNIQYPRLLLKRENSLLSPGLAHYFYQTVGSTQERNAFIRDGIISLEDFVGSIGAGEPQYDNLVHNQYLFVRYLNDFYNCQFYFSEKVDN